MRKCFMKFPTTSSQSGLELKKKRLFFELSICFMFVKLAYLSKEHSINFLKTEISEMYNLGNYQTNAKKKWKKHR